MPERKCLETYRMHLVPWPVTRLACCPLLLYYQKIYKVLLSASLTMSTIFTSFPDAGLLYTTKRESPQLYRETFLLHTRVTDTSLRKKHTPNSWCNPIVPTNVHLIFSDFWCQLSNICIFLLNLMAEYLTKKRIPYPSPRLVANVSNSLKAKIRSLDLKREEISLKYL